MVEKARRGLIRVPQFQRGLKWTKEHVIALFDSLFRGYPIGSFLLWEHKAPAEPVTLGHLRIDAPEAGQAWSVVDGQQRLTALVASLTAEHATVRDERFDIYFDTDQRRFVSPEKRKPPPPSWVAVSELLDAVSLAELMENHSKEQRRAAYEAGKRIREYQVPLYIIPTADEALLREIFNRVNNAGVSLSWTEVHDALFAKAGRQPSSVADVADQLAALGMGRPDESHLLSAMLAAVGLDPTRALNEHIERNRDDVANAAVKAMAALRRTFDFLRSRCAVAHIRLLPHWEPVPVLARFFLVHPEPHSRSLELLVRWVWRGPLTGGYKLDARTLLRRALESVDEPEHQAVQSLLTLVPKKPADRFEVPERFDARTASSRLALLALAELGPRAIDGPAGALNVAALIEEHDLSAFLKGVTSAAVSDVSSAANRFLHPPSKEFLGLITERARAAPQDSVLASHAISPAAARALVEQDLDAFLRERGKTLAGCVESLHARLAAWDHTDRPPLAYLMETEESQ